MPNTVKPARPSIEFVPDDDYLATAGVDEGRGALRLTPPRVEVLRALLRHGPFEDESGRATRLLHLAMGGREPSTTNLQRISSIVHNPVVNLALERTTRGRRTYRIDLSGFMPEAWRSFVEAETTPRRPVAVETTNEPEVEPEPTTEPEPEEPTTDEPTTEPVETPPDAGPLTDEVRLEIASSVASALLAKVVEIVSTPDRDKQAVIDLEQARQRLANVLADNDRLRRRLSETGDELHAVKHERDGLRQQLRVVQANLSRATGPGARRVVDELVHAEVDKILRAAPVAHAPDDNTNGLGPTLR